MTWPKYCVISEISRISRAVPNTNYVEYEVATATNSATFQINNANLYVPVVTLFINDNKKFLESIKLGFKRIISWNNDGSEITTQPKRLFRLFDSSNI